MLKKYAQVKVYHPGKGKFLSVDIAVEVEEKIFKEGTPHSIFDTIVMPIFSKLSAANLNAYYPNHLIFNLDDKCQQSNYVGTVEEIILRILEESKKNI